MLSTVLLIHQRWPGWRETKSSRFCSALSTSDLPTMLNKAAFIFATWFGTGLSPIAPGTVGSLFAIPLHLLAFTLPASWHVMLVLLVTVLGTLASHNVALVQQQPDPQIVVIDEVAGVMIALGLVRDGPWWLQALAWALFRALDIAKPGPVGWAEHAKPKGLGIMADDLVAGLIAGLVCRAVAGLL